MAKTLGTLPSPSTAELIEMGYETGGDLGEALRLWTDRARSEGWTVPELQETEELRQAFLAEFGTGPGHCDYHPTVALVDGQCPQCDEDDSRAVALAELEHDAWVAQGELQAQEEDEAEWDELLPDEVLAEVQARRKQQRRHQEIIRAAQADLADGYTEPPVPQAYD